MSKDDYLLEDLPGVGKKTAAKLRDLGINNVDTLAVTPFHEIDSNTEIKERMHKTYM